MIIACCSLQYHNIKEGMSSSFWDMVMATNDLLHYHGVLKRKFGSPNGIVMAMAGPSEMFIAISK